MVVVRIRDSGKIVAVILVALALLPGLVKAQSEVPLPRPRPPDASQPVQAAIDQACLDRLNALAVEFASVPSPPASNPACIIDTPVRLRTLRVPSRGPAVLRLPDEPILACRFAEPLAHWLGDLVAPLVAGRLATEVKAVRTGPGYECRNRNRQEDGKLSAHALGLALDIASFELTNGTTLPVKPNGDDRSRATMDALRTAACGWFTTVLGPGSDAAHAEHLHVDIAVHGSSDRYRICQ